MTLVHLFAEVRPTDVWDAGDVLGAAVLLFAAFIVIRVVRRR